MSTEFTNAISPRQEMVSYETLWGAPNMTLTKIAELYRRCRGLPSKMLDGLRSELVIDLDSLAREISAFVTKLAARFSISVHGTYQYPDRLREAQHPLELFYYRGDIGLVESRCISIVGARQCSEEGRRRAARLARELVAAKWTVVSGLAAGIDTAAMEAAIEAGGHTIGVIGTPIDQVYPKENVALQEHVAKSHLLVSHVPFYRYQNEPWNNHRFYFPQRNETMAALSAATIIVEASEKSGTHTQARECMRLGRKLFILQSCFDSGQKWPHAYEKRGAIRVTRLDDIFQSLGETANGQSAEQRVEEV